MKTCQINGGKKQARTEIAKNRLLGFVGYVGIVLVMFRVNISSRAGVFGREEEVTCLYITPQSI
jgi:hypothetical protein